MKRENFFKKKEVTLSFALIALAVGFVFAEPTITGNIINSRNTSQNLQSFIGFLLVICSAILTIYSLRKK